MPACGEGAPLYGGAVASESGAHRPLEPRELVREARAHLVVEAEHVVEDLHLARGAAAGADADGRHAQPRGDEGGYRGGNHLQDDREAARLLQRLGVLEEGASLGGGAALHAVPAQLRDGLRREADVPHHRQAGVHHGAHLLGGAHPSLELDGVGAPLLDEPHPIRSGGLRREVRPERQVGHEESAPRAARGRLAVVDHLRDGHFGGVVLAEDDHAERVAHQKHVRARAVRQPRARVVVRREHRERLARLVHPPQRVQPDLLGGRRRRRCDVRRGTAAVQRHLLLHRRRRRSCFALLL
mmetsp:Transcript_24472/g.77579  ORF Transcript_24472/g.77579 Transcript_24472/m.77579 type:complete len:298 (-) Transcript_24472:108-1001(-)